jgi:hypothetical protein
MLLKHIHETSDVKTSEVFETSEVWVFSMLLTISINPPGTAWPRPKTHRLAQAFYLLEPW